MKFSAIPLALALPVLLAGAELKIDHATVCTSHLDRMRQELNSADNLPSEYGGPHSNHATEMAVVSFPDGSYLELMGIQAKPDPAAVAAHVWSKFLRNDAGPCAFALRVADINAEISKLQAAGIHAGKPEAGGRTRPDGTRLSWETLDIGTGPRGSLFPFLIRDSTARELRAFPTGKPTTSHFDGIGKVVVGVQDLEGAITQYRKAFALPAPKRQKDAEFGADLAWFEGTPFVLATGLTPESWLSRRVRDYGNAPVAFVLDTTEGGGGSGSVSYWFGKPVFWRNGVVTGWRLGYEAPAKP